MSLFCTRFAFISTDPSFAVYHTLFFFFNDTATTEIYTLSLHDALPISAGPGLVHAGPGREGDVRHQLPLNGADVARRRSEEHTSELQSHVNLVCRLLLEKKKKKKQERSVVQQITLMRTTLSG